MAPSVVDFWFFESVRLRLAATLLIGRLLWWGTSKVAANHRQLH
jgi:hypothetical protein